MEKRERHVTETSRLWKDPHPEGIARYYVPPGRYTREDILAIVRTAWRDEYGTPRWDDLDSERKCTYFDTAVTVCNQGSPSNAFEERILAYRDLWDQNKKGLRDGKTIDG
jgi:hypothetical protein